MCESWRVTNKNCVEIVVTEPPPVSEWIADRAHHIPKNERNVGGGRALIIVDKCGPSKQQNTGGLVEYQQKDECNDGSEASFKMRIRVGSKTDQWVKGVREIRNVWLFGLPFWIGRIIELSRFERDFSHCRTHQEVKTFAIWKPFQNSPLTNELSLVG